MTGRASLPQARAARPEDAEPMLQVLCDAFGIDADAARPLFYQDPFFDFSHKRVLTTPDDGLVSCLTVIPATMLIGGTPIALGGIAGVATHQAHQRQGHAGRLLSATVAALADELRYPVSALFPYSYDYYRKFGWATASRSALWAGAAAALPVAGEVTRVRPVNPETDGVAIHRLQETAAHGMTGGFQRDVRRWKIIEDLSPGRRTVVYESRLGKIEGYLCFETQTRDGAAAVAVQEMLGVTEAARYALIGFLRRFEPAIARIEWEASVSDLQQYGLFSLPFLDGSQPQISLKPGMMLRVVDLSAALTRMHPAQYAPVLDKTGGTLTIRVTDSIRPQNERPVRLQRSGVHPGHQTDRDWIALDIAAMAQLFIGYLAPSEAATLGILRASSSETLLLAERLFPTRQPYISPLDQF